MIDILRVAVATLFDVIAWPILLYFLLINTSYLVLVISAAADFRSTRRRRRHSGRVERLGSHTAPGVSVVVPGYNEEAGVVEATRSLLGLRYHRHEVIVVNDGSTDDTLRVLIEAFDLVRADREVPYEIPTRQVPRGIYVPRDGYTRLTVIDKPNSGRSDSVNIGINTAVEDLIICMDADSLLDPDALLIVTEPFADDPLRTAATGGVVRIANGCTIRDGRIIDVRMPRNLLAQIQALEYLRSFFLGRSGWSRLRALILISGAFGCFRRDLLVEVGGLDPDSIGEDFELVMRLHRLLRERKEDYQVTFVPEPVCWTEVPETLQVLGKQRARWHRGLWETLVKHRVMFGNPRYGRAGMLAVPFYWAFELFAPLIEAVGLVLMILGFALGLVDPTTFGLFMAVAYGYAIVVALAAAAVDEVYFARYNRFGSMLTLISSAVLENIGYRQLHVIWRLKGWWQSLRGSEQQWGVMTRRGFTTESAS